MKKGGGTSPEQLLCDKKMACEINKVLDSISNIEKNNMETECQNKLEQIKDIINSTHKTRSISEICKVIDGTPGGKPKPKSKFKTRKKKNYKKKTKTRRKNKRKRNKRRKTYKRKNKISI